LWAAAPGRSPAICLQPGSAKFRAMPNKGKHIASPRHKVQNVSPDDVRTLEIERDRLAALDNRTEAERWLGDPPPHRSALAQRARAAGS
jgi:hypothetical protein